MTESRRHAPAADHVALPPRCSAILISLVLDTTFYGTPTLTPLRFLHTNVFQSISLFYGANAWHFYLSQGVPILLATQVPFFLDGIYSSRSHRLAAAVQNARALSALGVTLGATLGAYSLLSHKEWRFIHPLLPIMHLFVAYSLVRRRRGTTSPKTPRPHVSLPQSRLAQVLRIRTSHALVTAFSLLPAFYLTAFHGLAQNTVMSHLRTELERETATTLVAGRSRTSTLGFLMPCHSTGWQAFLHRPEMEESEGGAAGASDKGSTRLWMLTCEPPILYVFASLRVRSPCFLIDSLLSPAADKIPLHTATIATCSIQTRAATSPRGHYYYHPPPLLLLRNRRPRPRASSSSRTCSSNRASTRSRRVPRLSASCCCRRVGTPRNGKGGTRSEGGMRTRGGQGLWWFCGGAGTMTRDRRPMLQCIDRVVPYYFLHATFGHDERERRIGRIKSAFVLELARQVIVRRPRCKDSSGLEHFKTKSLGRRSARDGRIAKCANAPCRLAVSARSACHNKVKYSFL